MARTRNFKVIYDNELVMVFSVSGSFANVYLKILNPKVKVLLWDDWATKEIEITKAEEYED
jgi:hypothetical protein